MQEEYEEKTYFLPKMSLLFIIFLIVAKLLYLLFETYYNGFVIDIVTSTNATKELLEQLEGFGNKISTVGLTLLLLPVYYLIIKKYLNFHTGVRYIVLGISTLLTLVIIHSFLNSVIDRIVQANSDKRYEAYYIELFKYGMLTGKLGYSTFIPKEHLQNLSIDDKVIITNLFLLTQFDKALITKFVNEGKEKFFDIYVHKYFKNHYKKSQERVKALVDSIESDRRFYNDGIDKINSKFAKKESNALIDKKYEKFTLSLQQQYGSYRKSVQQYTRMLNKMIDNEKVLYKELNTIVQIKDKKRQQAQYKSWMHKHFNTTLPMSQWCQKRQCPSLNVFEDAIEKALLKAWQEKHGVMALNLSQRQFFQHPLVRSKVRQSLAKQHIYVGSKFNYSKRSYMKAYYAARDKEFKHEQRKFQKEFAQRTGIKHVKIGLSYAQFVRLYRHKIFSFYTEKKYNALLYQMILQKDYSQFYTLIYKPKLRTKYYDQAFPTAEDFNVKLQEMGDKAIKMLYIPPFAVAMSLIAGILNLVTVIVMILFIPTHKMQASWLVVVKAGVKTALLAMLLYMPYSIGKNQQVLQNYELLKTFDGTIYQPYISLLNWLMIVERFNFNAMYSPLKNSGLFDMMFSKEEYALQIQALTEELTGLNKRSAIQE